MKSKKLFHFSVIHRITSMDSDLGGENHTKIDAKFGNVDTKKDIREECRCPHRLEIYTKTKSEVSCQYLCRD